MNIVTPLILLNLLAFEIQAQNEIELKSDSLITLMSKEFRVSQNDSKIYSPASSGASWSKRFYLKSKKYFLNKYGQKDYLDYSFTFFYFDNADSCLKSRKRYIQHYSWKSGAITDSTKHTARSPSLNLINENSILIFEISCEEYEMGDIWSWGNLRKTVIGMFATNTTEIIENGCGGPITWISKKSEN